jgi:maltose alpha-D-glucosyltransferase / alpha-amylase
VSRLSKGTSPPWYQNAVIYQVPTALLRDTSGNGIGDLRGVTESLDHISRLGATVIWMQPFYRSPFVDGGYDVVDHFDVCDQFGTIEDFKDLVAHAHELDLKVVVDLVVQHTSVGHPWFREACRDPSSPFRDYYVWADQPHDTDFEPVFPTVEDSVWARSEEAGAYYRHVFYSHEPDLDVGNPAVRKEIHRIMRHWLDLGVDGFRVDAVPYMVQTAAQTDDRDDGFWILEELRAVAAEQNPDAVLIAESDVEPESYAPYFGDGNRMQMLLNFWVNNNIFLALVRADAGPIARALEAQPTPPAGCEYAMWLRNHDELDLERLSGAEREETMAVLAPHPQMRAFGRGIRRRLAPMLEDPRCRKLAIAVLCSFPGASIILYGDEIGMGEDLELPDRASVRTPMQWNASRNAGFSRAPASELVRPVIDSGPFGYHYVNVEDEENDPGSLLNTVRRLFACRGELGPFATGAVEVVDTGDARVLGLRHADARAPVLMLANLSAQIVSVDVPLDGMEEVVSDHSYEPKPGEAALLYGYGFRWFREVRS